MKMGMYMGWVVAIGVTLASVVAMSTTPTGSTAPTMVAPSASVSASASASATASVVVDREPLPESLASQSIPTEPSKVPTLDEWKTATPIAFTRTSMEGRQCRAYRVREWLKVDCAPSYAGIRQVGGNPNDVYLWVASVDIESNNGGSVVMAMRTGDRRVLQFYSVSFSQFQGPWSTPGMILEEVWIEGEKSPTLVLW